MAGGDASPSGSVCSSAGTARRGVYVLHLLTNLLAQRYPLDMIYRAYKWRQQVGYCLKWKSYANLHAFDTENPAIVEGLIWTAIAAAALKRFLAP